MKRQVLAVIAVLGLFGAACAGGSSEPRPTTPVSPPGGDGAITIVMDEFSFTPDAITLRAGETVRITFVNDGMVAHEFMAGQELMYEDGKPHGYMNDFFEGIAPEFTVTQGEAELEREDEGTEVYLESGASAVLTFTVPADKIGTYEFGCFVTGHYAAGQRGTLTVVA